jgi:hypothetical protein
VLREKTWLGALLIAANLGQMLFGTAGIEVQRHQEIQIALPKRDDKNRRLEGSLKTPTLCGTGFGPRGLPSRLVGTQGGLPAYSFQARLCLLSTYESFTALRYVLSLARDAAHPRNPPSLMLPNRLRMLDTCRRPQHAELYRNLRTVFPSTTASPEHFLGDSALDRHSRSFSLRLALISARLCHSFSTTRSPASTDLGADHTSLLQALPGRLLAFINQHGETMCLHTAE